MTPADLLSALANHLWQSTVCAGVAALLALALRHNHARTRHWLWLIASAKFLVPFALLAAAGGQLAQWAGPWTSEAVTHRELPSVIDEVSQAFVPVQAGHGVPLAAAHHALTLPAILPAIALAIWMLGAAAVTFHWFRRWLAIRAAVRAAVPLDFVLEPAAEIPVRGSAAHLEPGVFGIFRPVLLLPQGIADRLSPGHLAAIVAHEMCHVRGRDNLAAALHMAVEALFWFHPLVWWLGARLVEEREHACDEEVLRLGNHPEVYAESILKTCQFYLESPLACMSGIAGADLKKRIVRIMTPRAARRLGFGLKLLLTATGMAALAVPVVVGLLNAPQGRAQSPAADSGPHPSFEVVSIKPVHGGSELFRVALQPGRFTAENTTVKFLVQLAYDVKPDQISGGPAWIDSEHFVIEAKSEDVPAQTAKNISHSEQVRRSKLMLQSMLADRFALALHHETKELPMYVLVIAKNGPKMKASAPAPEEPPSPDSLRALDAPGRPQPRSSFRMAGRGDLTVLSENLDRFADLLSHQVGRLVVNQTGLKGSYDFTLKWTPDEHEPGGPGEEPPPGDGAGPSIFTALQEQLGLKLVSQKGPVDTIVIDRVEKPAEN